MERLDFSSIIRKDREEHKSKKFEGTFLEYLEIVKENPEITMLAHQRMYKLITEPGVTVIRTEENPRLRRIYGNDIIKKYKFFEDEFFGIDKTIMKIVRYFHSAAMRRRSKTGTLPGGTGRCGKIIIDGSLKRALEMSPPIYALKDAQ